ncbi:hypothetical protein BYT27DRAFT_7258594 [Phlegmacium glaucopus]|nr:hypothetical protein BYT27DRAFT_7258594 [Phlegmacium glaucopus]
MQIPKKNEPTTDFSAEMGTQPASLAIQSVIAGLQGLQLDPILAQSATGPAIEITLTELGAALQSAGVHLISEQEERARSAREKAACEARDARFAAIVAALQEVDAKRTTGTTQFEQKENAQPTISTTHSEETGMPREIYCVESQAQSDMVVAPNIQVSADTTEVATTSQLDDAGGPATTSAALIPDTITGFMCVACNTHNLLRPAKEQWYAVIKGYAVGVFHNW